MINFEIKNGASVALKLTLLLVICVVSVYLLPKVGTFQYNYQKGLSWRYETLIAPFDFPIYKTEAELSDEKDAIIKKNIPCFIINNEIEDLQLKQFANKANDLIVSSADVVIIQSKLKEIYSKGIVLVPEHLQKEHLTTVRLIDNNVAENVNIDKVYTLKQAYQAFYDFITQSNLSQSDKQRLISLNLNKFLQANVLFDENRTTQSIDDLIKSISQTKDLVEQGAVIIRKQEIVSDDKYQIINSLQKEYERSVVDDDTYIKILFGQIILVVSSLLIFSLYFFYTKREVFTNNREFIFIYGSFFTTILIASIGFNNNIDMLAVPTLIFVLVVNILIGSRSAIFLLLSSTFLLAYFVPNSYMYAFMQIVAGIVGIYSLRSLHRRGQLFLALFFIFLSYVFIYTAFILIQDGDIQSIQWNGYLWIAINCSLLSLSYAIIYVFEKLFGYVSDITLVELSNPSHPLLRALIEKAPGTYQHSTMVAALADEAVYEIGGNPLLVRVGAYFHDIGKVANPLLFIENQSGGVNPHSKLSHIESARLIISHVSDGVKLANKYNLPDKIIDFIRMHHGRSMAKYFYNSYKNENPDIKVDESLFTYEGPDPTTKETAVLMMADVVEAASRSLSEKTVENISELVNTIIDSQKQEGRFDNANITYKDITTVKSVFIERLTSIYHSRIAYPKLNIDESSLQEK